MRTTPRSAALVAVSVLTCLAGGCDRPQATPPIPAVTAEPPSVSAPATPRPPPTSEKPPTPSAIAPPPSADVPSPGDTALVEARPYKLGVPPGLDASKPAPLVLFLHGYGATGRVFESALGVGSVAQSRKFIYAIPDGTLDSHKMRFWNASDACCDFDAKHIDDVAYLRAVLADAASKQRIDPKRVFVVGFSNGGFMAHRLACELPDTVAGIASVAGAAWKDPSKCKATSPVTVLQIHGDADPIVRYDGGHVLDKLQMQVHPTARETVGGWATRDRCGATLLPGNTIDLEDKLDGAETVKAHYDGCVDSAVELWTVQGGNHFIAQKPRAIEAVIAFLLAHPKK